MSIFICFCELDYTLSGLGPGCFSTGRKDVHFFQFSLELWRRFAGQKTVENMFDRFGAFRVDLRLSILAAPVADKVLILERAFALLEQATFAHCDILAQRLALGLGESREPGQVNFAAEIAGVQALFLELDDHAQAFQQTDVSDTVQRIAGEPAQGFGQDHVDLVLFASFNHLHESRSCGIFDAANPVVGKDTGHLLSDLNTAEIAARSKPVRLLHSRPGAP